MSTQEKPVIRHAVSASDWARFNRLQAEKAALEAALKAAKEALNLPTADEIGEPARIVLVDGNGDEVGKGSVFLFPGATVPPGLRMRLS